MRSAIVAGIVWISLLAQCQAQNCVVSGGTNFGTIVQNCAPSPQIIPLKPQPGQPIIPVDGPPGRFLYQVFVKITAPIDVRVVACGDDVFDVDGSPWPAEIASISQLDGLPQNCIGKQFSQAAAGTWLLEATSKSKDKPVSIQAAVGDFTRVP
jgi:hypothetical protein